MDNKKLINPVIFDQPKDQKRKLINPVIFEAPDKSFEDKVYIILYYLDEDDEFDQDLYRHVFAIHIGRTETYRDIINKLESGVPIDIHRSKIITETKQTETETGNIKYYLLPFDECISLYSFMISVKDYYSDDDFDIEVYNNSEVPEDDFNIKQSPNYLSPDQREYRKLLEASMQRDRFLDLFASQNNNNEDSNV